MADKESVAQGTAEICFSMERTEEDGTEQKPLLAQFTGPWVQMPQTLVLRTFLRVWPVGSKLCHRGDSQNFSPAP